MDESEVYFDNNELGQDLKMEFSQILKEAEKQYNQNLNWREFTDLFLGCDSKYMPKDRRKKIVYFQSEVFRNIMFMKLDLESIQRD